MITRRHALALVAGASWLPSRAVADVAPQRSEIRDGLGRHFTDAGTAGTFVGYRVEEYLVIASDRDRSGQASFRPRLSRSRIR